MAGRRNVLRAEASLAGNDATGRPTSVPLSARPAAEHSTQMSVNILDDAKTRPKASSDSNISMVSKDNLLALDLMTHLKRSEPSVVKTRSGSVLSRGFILKTDYYPSGALCLNFTR